jgi:predicted TIM-barrel fold metal-dependent hydrolase
MGDPAWRRGYALLEKYGLSFDLQTPWWHLAEAAALARDFPNTQVILNHTGLPADRTPEGLAGWRRAMQTLAAAPNVAVKISGLGQPGQPWTVAANGQIIRDTIAIFGVDRCMFASNFPVDGLCADFDAIFSGFKTIVADLSQAEQLKLFHDNAMRIYRLNPASRSSTSPASAPNSSAPTGRRCSTTLLAQAERRGHWRFRNPP